jgi:TM2 domain-containing membrane protein YozV
MNLATKAALYNALLFPGWGQIYLKRYKKGIAIIITVIAGTLSIFWSIIQTAISSLRIAPFRKGTVTFDAVINFTINSIKETNMYCLLPVLSLIIMLLIFSVIDAYTTGKKEMAKASIAADPESTSPES